MKLLLVLVCAFVAVSAGGYASEYPYPDAQHLPVISANGVPLDTVAVPQATAAHLQYNVDAYVRKGEYTILRSPGYDHHHAGYYPDHNDHYGHHDFGYFDNHGHGGYYDHHHHFDHHHNYDHGYHKLY